MVANWNMSLKEVGFNEKITAQTQYREQSLRFYLGHKVLGKPVIRAISMVVLLSLIAISLFRIRYG